MGLHLRQRAQELARTVATTRGRPSRSSSRRDATESEHERANRIVRERKLNYDRLS